MFDCRFLPVSTRTAFLERIGLWLDPKCPSVGLLRPKEVDKQWRSRLHEFMQQAVLRGPVAALDASHPLLAKNARVVSSAGDGLNDVADPPDARARTKTQGCIASGPSRALAADEDMDAGCTHSPTSQPAKPANPANPTQPASQASQHNQPTQPSSPTLPGYGDAPLWAELWDTDSSDALHHAAKKARSATALARSSCPHPTAPSDRLDEVKSSSSTALCEKRPVKRAGAALLQTELEALKRTVGVEATHLVESRRIALEKDIAVKVASKEYAGAALLQAELTKSKTTAEAESQQLGVQSVEKANAIEREMEIKVAAGDYAGAAPLQTELKALKATPRKQQFRQPEMSQDRRAF